MSPKGAAPMSIYEKLRRAARQHATAPILQRRRPSGTPPAAPTEAHRLRGEADVVTTRAAGAAATMGMDMGLSLCERWAAYLKRAQDGGHRAAGPEAAS